MECKELVVHCIPWKESINTIGNCCTAPYGGKIQASGTMFLPIKVMLYQSYNMHNFKAKLHHLNTMNVCNSFQLTFLILFPGERKSD